MMLSMFGLPGALASLGVAASIYGFSRDQESRADRLGVRMMKKAGYDGRAAAQIWDDLLAELKVRGGEDAGKRSVMFATHPPAADRRDELLKLAGDAGGRLGAEDLEAVVAPLRLDWLQEEIRRGQFEESLELFNRKLQQRPDDAEYLYARGEVRRLRDQPEDLEAALQDLQRGGAAPHPPAELFRSLGLLHRRRQEPVQAAVAFQKYLALAPEAGDAGLIRTYLTDVKP
jgi:predicted Zn-dependent protease